MRFFICFDLPFQRTEVSMDFDCGGKELSTKKTTVIVCCLHSSFWRDKTNFLEYMKKLLQKMNAFW